jgi:RND family efflux transporter MFP subunit
MGLVVAGWAGVTAAQEGGPGGEGEDSGGPPGGGPPPAVVRVGTVQMQTVQARRLITGQVEPVRHAQVAAEEPGQVTHAPPDAGVTVEAGQMLAHLDDTLLQADREAAAAALAEARALVSQRQAELELAVKQRKRFAQLVPTDSASQTEYDGAVRDQQVSEAQLQTARAMVAQSQAKLDRLDQRITNMTIAAPFDGVIIEKLTEVGEWLTPGQPVARMIATAQVDVVLNVPELMVEHLRTEEPVELRIEATGLRPKGRVHRIVPSADRRARTFPVMIRLDNPEGRFKPGMTAEAELPTGREIQATTVPRDAVQVTPQGPQVFAVRGGVALPVGVRIRFAVDSRFVVDAELGPGEQVVVEGNERLFPGQPVIMADQPDQPGQARRGDQAPADQSN